MKLLFIFTKDYKILMKEHPLHKETIFLLPGLTQKSPNFIMASDSVVISPDVEIACLHSVSVAMTI